MARTADSRTSRAGQFAHRLLIEYARSDSAAIARVADELALEDDPELTLIVLDRALQVSVGLLVMLSPTDSGSISLRHRGCLSCATSPVRSAHFRLDLPPPTRYRVTVRIIPAR